MSVFNCCDFAPCQLRFTYGYRNPDDYPTCDPIFDLVGRYLDEDGWPSSPGVIIGGVQSFKTGGTGWCFPLEYAF